MNVGMISVQMKFWRGFMNVGTALCNWSFDVASWMLTQHWCKRSFDMASWMLAWLQYKWSVVAASWKRWMLAWLRCKWSFDVTQCKYWCNFNASTSANVEFCRGFMAKMNCWHSFMASVRMKCWRSFMTKMNVGMASMQIECCCGFMAKEWSVDVANRMLLWHSFGMNEV